MISVIGTSSYLNPDGTNSNRLKFEQTPFEKSIAKRLTKASNISKLVSLLTDYTAENDLEAIGDLSSDLELFANTSKLFYHTVKQYIAVSLSRKNLFLGDDISIFELALMMKKEVFKKLPAESTHRKTVQQLLSSMYKQNPLAPPFDFAKPNINKKLDDFNESYTILFGLYKLIVFELEQIKRETEIDYPAVWVKNSIHEAENFTYQIAQLTETIFQTHKDRIEIFHRIGLRAKLIANRCRLIYGPQNEIYKSIRN